MLSWDECREAAKENIKLVHKQDNPTEDLINFYALWYQLAEKIIEKKKTSK
jgi:hypothetical protein